MADKAYDEKVRNQIVERLKDAVSAWNRGDLDGYMDVYLKSEFVTLIPDDGFVWGIGKIRKAYENQIAARGQLSFHVVEVLPLGSKDGAEYAFVSGHFAVIHEGLKGHSERGNFTLLMMRSGNDTWYVFKDHSA